MRLARALVLSLIFSQLAWAEAPAVEFSVDMRRSTVHIGEPVRVGIAVKHSKDVQITWPAIGSEWKAVAVERIIAKPPQVKGKTVLEQRFFWLSSFSAGEHVLETGNFVYRGRDGKEGASAGPQIKLTVATRLPEKWQALDIMPIRPGVLVLSPWLIAAFAALIAAAGFWIWRRRRYSVLTAANPPPRPAHELALQALDQLQRDQLPQQGQFERYYVRLSGIIRAYIERRFQLRAPEMTTEEFFKTATHASALSFGHRSLLQDFLAQSDLVKFAKYQPSNKEAEGAFEAALRFVRETAQTETTTHASAAAVS